MTDNRETVELNLTDDEFLAIAKMAHDRDITFNQMAAIILQEHLDKNKQ